MKYGQVYEQGGDALIKACEKAFSNGGADEVKSLLIDASNKLSTEGGVALRAFLAECLAADCSSIDSAQRPL